MISSSQCLRLRLLSVSLLLLISFPLAASRVQLIQPYGGRNISGLLNSHVNFTWTFTGSLLNARWGLKSDNTDDIDLQLVSVTRDRTVTITDIGQYKNRVNGYWNGAGQVAFTLRSLQTADEGYFAVKIADSVNFVDVGDTVHLDVNERPSITAPVIAGHYIEGSLVSINCTAAGTPEPDVHWYKEDQLKGAGHKKALLTFNSIIREDSGNYTCVANNSVGSTDVIAKILVHYRPEGTTLTTSVTGNAAVQGNSVTLTCRVTGANPAVSVYRIYFNDSNTPVTEPTDGRYTINNVQRSQHHGRYRCIPRNDVGDGPPATVDLNINVPTQLVRLPRNQTVNETDPVLLRCEASGYPAPTLTWTKDGDPVTASDKILDITQSKRTDNGRYVCKADNGVGQPQTAVAYVTVQYPATVVRHSPTNIKSWIGRTVTFICVSDGVPTPTVTWFKPDGNELDRVTSKENIVDVNMAGDGDFGDYKCIAHNVLYPPDTVTINVQQIKKPSAPLITPSDENIQATSLAIKWREPTSDGGSPITAYRVVIMTEIKNENITNPSTTSLSVGGLNKDTKYTVKVFARNFVFEGPAGSKTVQTKDEGSDSPQNNTQEKQTGATCKRQITNLHAIYLAVIAFLLLVIFVLIVILWRIRSSPEFKRATRRTCSRCGEAIIMNPMAAEDSIKNSNRTKPDNITYEIPESSDYMPLQPSTTSWEMKRNQVEIMKVIGKGAFSQVAKATARGISGNKEREITVAVKMLKADAPESDRKDLLSELELMKKLKPHPHVIKLIGCVTESDPLLVLIEYVPYGDLLGFLRKNRGLSDTYFKDPDVKPQTSLTAEQLLRFAWQIADGMCYLSSRKIIHRDLAARNVLVGEREKCKVTDFGMSRNVEQDDIYTRKSRGRLPVKWTAYEALLYGTYTTQSDVWSYGVVLYEILTVGGTPYPDIQGRQIANKLQEGYRMPKPQHVDSKLYQVMLQCWQESPRKRPTFSKLKETMKEMEKNHRTYVNLKQYDNSLYANVKDLVDG